MIHDLQIREGLEGLTPSRIITLYRRAPLLRAVDTPEQVWKMFNASSLVLAAWNGHILCGIARVLTDGVKTSYLCELAVEPDVQGLGVGKALVSAILEQCKGTEIVLRDSNISATYYARLGFRKADNAWIRTGSVR